MDSLSSAEAPITHGARDFSNRNGGRLHVLQIGLGTYGTFLENAAASGLGHPAIKWLLDAVSVDSWPEIVGVGVEPIPEHVSRLKAIVDTLPNTSLVQAAVSSDNSKIMMHCIPSDTLQRCHQQMAVFEKQEQRLSVDIEYLLNMASVGRDHPDFHHCARRIKEEYGVVIQMEQIEALSVTYGKLSSMLRFSGVEVLIVDAEGCDCRILQSVIDHCVQQPENSRPWPHIIQFETMGWGDKFDGPGAEESILGQLVHQGYLIFYQGKDTVLVSKHASQLPRVETWLMALRCIDCRETGLRAMPFHSRGRGYVCETCTRGAPYDQMVQALFDQMVQRESA